MRDDTSTRTRLLDLAQELAQTRGINGFSFKHLARGVGISTASVHHHFPTKDDLSREIMARYRVEFAASLEEIARRTRSPRRKLEGLADLFRDTLRQGNRLCLCGMLATEYATLPEPVRLEVRVFYRDTERWLRNVLEEGRREGTFRLDRPRARAAAKTYLATLEGAMIAARTFGEEGRIREAAGWILASLGSTPRSSPKGR